MPVRVGHPHYSGGLAKWCGIRATPPRWGCCHGNRAAHERAAQQAGIGTFGQVLDRMKSWFKGNFLSATGMRQRINARLAAGPPPRWARADATVRRARPPRDNGKTGYGIRQFNSYRRCEHV